MDKGSIPPPGTVSAEEVISKLKDDGDFDKLRLKIVSKLKENEELRNDIISAVKQSAALNREGAESLTRRQLSDAIHEEIGGKVMTQISDVLWGVIRSSDGMRGEISDTVESVYDRLVNPKGKEVHESAFPLKPTPTNMEASNENFPATTACEREDMAVSDGEPREPPGFIHQQPGSNQVYGKEDVQPLTSHEDETELHIQQPLSPSIDDPGVPPGFASFESGQQTYTGSDEDPDVPPGFG